ncbi:hypothetical protein N7466_000326 [Penicillium verhagenii]|uniref:uncharacterized protein n=1 Tax=Penicillium verhagenii TaxID=1562060 RepID=UPI0025452A78|nr:uncharacterized protein N7466_000326 [Penicillium verhagenii]KAJ5947311.1 hypothetical protein N7466_000326 [Penicillium verhagenii]
MTTRKHNDFLDIAASDDEDVDRGYDSEEKATESKGRAVKRRKQAADTKDFFGLESDEDSEGEQSEEEESRVKGKARAQPKATKSSADVDAEEAEEGGDDLDEDEEESAYLDTSTIKSKNKTLKPLKPKKKQKLGVVYLSSLPPYLRPMALKSILEKRGFPLTKVFLSKQVNDKYKKSNKRQLYTEGWVELRKKDAKIMAETLNAMTIGGLGYYRDDLFNMKYLSGFRWDDLTDQINRERAERESKRRVEDARAHKEEKMFLAGVESGRVADGMAKKNEEKRKRKLEEAGKDAEPVAPKKQIVRRRFVQNDVVKPKQESAVGDETKRVLGKIF